MTAWSPGDGGPDVLSLGDAGTSRPATTRIVAGALLCAGVGLALAAHFLGAHPDGAHPLSSRGLAPSPFGAHVAGSAAVHALRVTQGVAPVGCGHGPQDGERAACPPRHPARTDELTGSWVRIGVSGVWRDLGGREVMRFGAGGGFSWGLVGPYRTVRGRYVLSGGTVRVTALPASLCHPGATYAWWARVTRAGRLHLDHVAGTERDGCTAGPQVWSGHRLRGTHVTALRR